MIVYLTILQRDGMNAVEIEGEQTSIRDARTSKLRRRRAGSDKVSGKSVAVLQF